MCVAAGQRKVGNKGEQILVHYLEYITADFTQKTEGKTGIGNRNRKMPPLASRSLNVFGFAQHTTQGRDHPVSPAALTVPVVVIANALGSGPPAAHSPISRILLTPALALCAQGQVQQSAEKIITPATYLYRVSRFCPDPNPRRVGSSAYIPAMYYDKRARARIYVHLFTAYYSLDTAVQL